MQAKIRLSWMSLIFVVALAALPAAAQLPIPVGNDPITAAANPLTNRTFVVNFNDGTVSVVDGTSLSVVQTVSVGKKPSSIAVNSVTNKVYVVTCGGDSTCKSPGTLLVIDGGTFATQSVAIGINQAFSAVAVNPVTNTIYVMNLCGNDPACSSPGTVTVINGATLNIEKTVTVGFLPYGLAVNAATNTIYVANDCGNDPTCSSPGTATVINGATLVTQSVNTQVTPYAIAVDPQTNMIFVVNYCGADVSCGSIGSVTAINGTTGVVQQNIAVDYYPGMVTVDPVTSTVYVGNFCGFDPTCSNGIPTISSISESSLTVTDEFAPCNATSSLGNSLAMNRVTNTLYIPCDGFSGTQSGLANFNGATFSLNEITFGTIPVSPVVNERSNVIYVPDSGTNQVWLLAGQASAPAQFVAVTPCRVVDTRETHNPIQGGTSQSFPISELGGCHVPDTASAYSLNVTVVPPSPLGYLSIWPTGEDQPIVSTMNSLDGRIKANAAIVPAGYQGAVSVFASNTTDLVLDIDGYFTAPTAQTAEFYPLQPCRVIDTRGGNGSLGGPFLTGGAERDFSVLTSPCIPSGVNPQAYSFNVTVVPHTAGTPLGYLTMWPQGESQPGVSTLNNLTATAVANAAIVPAGAGGAIAAFASNDTDLVVDINGYYAAPASGGLSLYTVEPCRVLDTRATGSGAPFTGELTVAVGGSLICAYDDFAAQAFVFNATVVPPGGLGYLTLWPDGLGQPVASTLNALDGSITSNMAIVPTNNGSVDAFASNLTQLVLDISSYFAP